MGIEGTFDASLEIITSLRMYLTYEFTKVIFRWIRGYIGAVYSRNLNEETVAFEPNHVNRTQLENWIIMK